MTHQAWWRIVMLLRLRQARSFLGRAQSHNYCVSGLGGVVIGIIVGIAVMRIHRRLDER